MEFGVDYSEVSEGNGLLPIGEYEVIIKYAGEDTTKSGTVYINATCVIRNDVEQKYKNKYLFYPLWHRKEPTQADLTVGGYSVKQIQTLAKAAGLPNGKKYESLAAWCADLKDKVIRVTVKHEEFNGDMQAKISYVNESKFPTCNHEWKKKADEVPTLSTGDNSDFEEITGDDDLPF